LIPAGTPHGCMTHSEDFRRCPECELACSFLFSLYPTALASSTLLFSIENKIIGDARLPADDDKTVA
jgi:hypothetical protein